MASVQFSGIRKSFGAVQVLKDVSIEIPDGEFVALVGPSGCGKSTLLRMIAGLEPIEEGSIRIGSQVVNSLPPGSRDIAMVFQNYALYPHMSVSANMGFPLRMRRQDPLEIEERVRNAAEILNLTPLLSRTPRQLSGGQRQRVAMGRAIVRDPKVFLFDEPLSNLDAKLRVSMRSEIKSLHRRLGATMIYVTHDQIEAMTMADRVVVMHDGVIEQVGAPLELYDRPANMFVAGFIGSPAMNFVQGSCDADGFVADSGLRFPCTPPAGCIGKRVFAGVRPEHFVRSAGGPSYEVLVVEPTGLNTQLVVRHATQQFMLHFQDRVEVEPGDEIQVEPHPARIHLFEPNGGARLS